MNKNLRMPRHGDRNGDRATVIASVLVIAVAIGLGLLLGGCSTTKYVATPRPFCAAVKTVCISKDDTLTEGTASQIEANNLGHAKVCRPRKAVDCRKPAS